MVNAMSLKASILVNNYNYGRFVAAAIDSALHQDWPDKEIIVVDDGSTDDSRAIISAYGAKIRAVFKENGGQTSAANLAFKHCTGDVIFFLDSDDVLSPNAVTTVIEAWHDHVSKIQFPMLMMREDGSLTGAIYPNLEEKHTPTWIRRSMELTSFYTSSPTSGNAWSRKFIDDVFPIPEQVRFFDGCLSVLAPFVGDVVSLTTPLLKYRINTNNFWTRQFSPELVAESADDEAKDTMRFNRILNDKLGIQPLDHCKNFTYMMKLVVTKKFNPGRCVESWPTVLALSYRSVMNNPNLSAKTKVLLLGWCFAVFAAPKIASIQIVKLRFVPSYRPPIVEALLKLSGWHGIATSQKAATGPLRVRSTRPFSRKRTKAVPVVEAVADGRGDVQLGGDARKLSAER
jgi:glycosyltransferase involved in cell wall biosynthesis